MANRNADYLFHRNYERLSGLSGRIGTQKDSKDSKL